MARWIALAMIALAVGVVAWSLRPQAPPPREARNPAPAATPAGEMRDLPQAPAAETPSDAPPASELMALLAPAAEPAEAPPTGAAPTVRMPVAAKLTARPLSEVEHELVGAWDDDPESADPGVHRTFVAIVDPELSTRELETLVRDIADRHRGAEVLDVRIYDSPVAAQTPPNLDGGRARLQHLVARIVRNDRLGYDQITVRGQPIVR